MLTERQLGIVLAVVYEYIKTGEPAGSRTITKKYIKGLSPATIRNEMADLEEMGYFYQPHTSAGRLPTAKSYRVYVDSVTSRERLRPRETIEWQREIENRRNGIEDLLHYVTHMLSRLTNYVGVAAVAGLDATEIQHIDLMPLGGSHILALIVLRGGLVHHSQFPLPCEVEPAAIEELTRRINTVASGRAWSEVRDVLYSFVLNGLEDVEEACRMALRELDNFLTMQNYRFFSSGAQYILNLPHFQTLGRLQAVLLLLEQEKPLARMIENCRLSEALKVSIGEDNDAEGVEGMGDNAMILIPAQARQQKAVLGLIGPLRMDYERSINILEAMVDALSKKP
ncbi:MAG: heat-inducible transcriptional repressor HrcA [Synergistaceae bacterium]|jgi:heat-inducible transcriptional repressor|nr:heat-inducible transcriptional repressor HrcA [Synergistaceae bacterium]